LEISRACEDSGFDSVWATDHIIMPAELREPYGQLIEPLITLAWIAAGTEKLKLGTSCIVLPQRNPILLAKQAAALDVYSKGRVILGFGAGWAEQEFAYLNADFGKRGKVMDESIRLMKALWKDEVVNFEGDFFRVRGALFFPKPVKKEIPVWIGGNGATAIRRVIMLGDGWHPVGPDLEDFRSGVEKIRRAGRDVTFSMRMTTDVRKKRETYVGTSRERRIAVSGSSSEIRKQIDDYAGAGLQYYCASINHPAAAEIIRDVRKFSSEVMHSYA